jgi:hypothetical protein
LSLSKYVEPERGVVRWGGSELFVGQRLSTHRGRHGLPGRQPKCGAPTQIAKRKIGVIAGAALEGSQRRRKAGVYCAAGLRRGFAELEEKRPRRVPAGAGTSATETRSEQGARLPSAERRGLRRGASQLPREGRPDERGVPPGRKLDANARTHVVRRKRLRLRLRLRNRLLRRTPAVGPRTAGRRVAGQADSTAARAISTATAMGAATSDGAALTILSRRRLGS